MPAKPQKPLRAEPADDAALTSPQTAPAASVPGAQPLLHLQAFADLRLAPGPRAPIPAGYLPPITDLHQRNTTRLLPARYSDSVLSRLTDSPGDLQAIYELDSASNDRLLAESGGRLGITSRELACASRYARIINAAFAHPHPQGARFSTAMRGAWYAAFDLATAKAEVLFHRAVLLNEIHWNAQEDLDYDHYLADFNGPFHDLREPVADAPDDGTAERERSACIAPGSYIASQQLTMRLLQRESFGVVYPSARRAGGTCLACFRPALVSNVRKRELLRLSWFPDKGARFTRIPRT